MPDIEDIQKRLKIARLDLVNARNAVDHLPAIEAKARAVVADAQARLDAVAAGLDHVLNVEIPATTSRPAELEAEIARLEAELGQ